MPEENEEQESGKKKNPLFKFIIIVLVVLVLGAGGFFGWNTYVKGNVSESGEGTSVSKLRDKNNKTPNIVVPLESFIVNLMDKSGLGKRYLKVTIELEVGGEQAKLALDRFKPQLKDTILLLLSNQTFEDISTMEGKLELKQALLFRINQMLGEKIVERIYFTEFVVQ